MSRLYHSKLWVMRLWNASNTLLGLVGSLGGRRFWNAEDAICEVVGGWFIRFLDARGWAAAITLGDMVLYCDDDVRRLLRDHEYVHVCQGRLWGPFFLPAYLIESAYQKVRTGDGYFQNRFEIEAYKK